MALWLDLIPKLHRWDKAHLQNHPPTHWGDLEEEDISYSTTGVRNMHTRTGAVTFPMLERSISEPVGHKMTSTHLAGGQRNFLRSTYVVNRRPTLSVDLRTTFISVALQQKSSSTHPLSVTLSVGCAFLGLNIILFGAVFCRQLAVSRRHDGGSRRRNETHSSKFGGRYSPRFVVADRESVQVIDLDGACGKATSRASEHFVTCLVESDVDASYLQTTPLVKVSPYNDDVTLDDAVFLTPSHGVNRRDAPTFDHRSLNSPMRNASPCGGDAVMGNDLMACECRSNSNNHITSSVRKSEYKCALGLT